MTSAFEYNPQMEAYEAGEYEWSGETEWGGEVLSEAETMELAGELLEVTNEAELDRFLGDLIKKAGSAIGSVVRSPVGKAIGGWLKGAAKQALPIAGGALGDSSAARWEPKSAAGSHLTQAAPWALRRR